MSPSHSGKKITTCSAQAIARCASRIGAAGASFFQSAALRINGNSMRATSMVFTSCAASVAASA